MKASITNVMLASLTFGGQFFTLQGKSWHSLGTYQPDF